MDALSNFFAQNVVEVVAKRRNRPPSFMAKTRRFLCTNSYPLLNSIIGKTAFHFQAPTHPPPYKASAYNLITVFDLFRQEYRNINLDDYDILGAMPVKNEQEINEFWQYFTDVLLKLSAKDKIKFMNT